MDKSFFKALDKLIDSAEDRTEKNSLNDLLQKNLAYFKSKGFKLYDDYKNYQFKKLQIHIDKNGVNLKNNDGQMVYPEAPKVHTKKQLTQYFKSPLCFSYFPSEMKPSRFIEPKYYNCFFQHFNNRYENSLEHPIGLMIINGVGLGYHIQSLIEKLDIYHIAIFDASHDSFYASLHTLDWQTIFEHFSHEGRSIHIDIGHSAENNLSNISYIFRQIADFNRLNVFCFNHLQFNGPLSSELSFQLLCNYQKTAIAHGFIEDERISIAHSRENLCNKVPIFKKGLSAPLPPVFLIGNGPSLDDLIPTIKDNKENAIIICCGSAIHTLLNYNIRPDILIIMERSQEVYPFLLGLDEHVYNKTFLVALNTVYPKIFKLFKHAVIALKSTDVGSMFIQQKTSNNFPTLPLPNPLVNNTGLSIALAIGFSDIYLMGIDLGMKCATQHHAQKSEYYNKKNKKYDSNAVYQAKFQVKGNFSSSVYADDILLASNKAMADLIPHYENTRVFNLSDGAFIDNTHSMPANKLEISSSLKFTKKNIIFKIKNSCFLSPEINQSIDIPCVEKEVFSPILSFINHLTFDITHQDVKSVYKNMNQHMINLRVLAKSHPFLLPMLFGSLSTFFTCLLHAVSIAQDTHSFKKNYHLSLEIIYDYLNAIKNLLKNNALHIDKKN